VQISPRYGTEPIIVIDGPPDDVRAPFLRQSARLRELVAGLTDEQWRTPSRCAGWTVQDVIAHLVGVKDFWRISITAGVKGSPTRFLEGFDPKATPAAMVDGMRSMTPAETLARFVASDTGLCDAVAALDDAGWCATAETPPGDLPVRLLVHHALWDAWVHERDIALPLGLTPEEEADEIVCSLRYAAGLGPAFAVGGDRAGALVVDVTDPVVRFVVEVGDSVHLHCGATPTGALHLRGDAVVLLEALSVRGQVAPDDVPAEQAWLLDGLASAFS
jgi:uncharacterized protein (TIGR03083 family)